MIKTDSIVIKFGQRLKSLRVNKKLTQEKLATLSSLHPTYVSQAERGKRNVTLVSLYKISKGLDCTMSELVDDIDRNVKYKK